MGPLHAVMVGGLNKKVTVKVLAMGRAHELFEKRIGHVLAQNEPVSASPTSSAG